MILVEDVSPESLHSNGALETRSFLDLQRQLGHLIVDTISKSALAVLDVLVLCLETCNLRLSLSGDTSGNTLVSSQTNMGKNTKGMERCSAT